MDMAKDDIFSGLSVDKILSDVKAMQGEDGLKLWSLEDIDQLLAGNAPSADDPIAPVPETPMPAQKEPQPKPSEAAEVPAVQKNDGRTDILKSGGKAHPNL